MLQISLKGRFKKNFFFFFFLTSINLTIRGDFVAIQIFNALVFHHISIEMNRKLIELFLLFAAFSYTVNSVSVTKWFKAPDGSSLFIDKDYKVTN